MNQPDLSRAPGRSAAHQPGQPLSVAEVWAAATSSLVPMPAETSGYLVLGIADLMERSPAPLDENTTLLSLEGTISLIHLSTSTQAPGHVDALSVERSLRALLGRLLSVAHGSAQALTTVSRRKPGRGLAALVHELEEALIPVNRAAGRRALARLAREAERCRGQLPRLSAARPARPAAASPGAAPPPRAPASRAPAAPPAAPPAAARAPGAAPAARGAAPPAPAARNPALDRAPASRAAPALAAPTKVSREEGFDPFRNDVAIHSLSEPEDIPSLAPPASQLALLIPSLAPPSVGQAAERPAPVAQPVRVEQPVRAEQPVRVEQAARVAQTARVEPAVAKATSLPEEPPRDEDPTVIDAFVSSVDGIEPWEQAPSAPSAPLPAGPASTRAAASFEDPHEEPEAQEEARYAPAVDAIRAAVASCAASGPARAAPAVREPPAPRAVTGGGPATVEQLLARFTTSDTMTEREMGRQLKLSVGLEPTAVPPGVVTSEPPAATIQILGRVTEEPEMVPPKPPADPLPRAPRRPRSSAAVSFGLLLVGLGAALWVWTSHPGFFTGHGP